MTARRHANGLIDRLRASYASGQPGTLDPVPAGEASRHVRALRRAATYASLGVRISTWDTPDGVVITFQARDKSRA